MFTAIDSRPELPPIAPIAARKCSNAEPGSYNHECGKPAQYAVTYWVESFSGYDADWHTAHYCAHCFTTGTEGTRARNKAARIVSLQPRAPRYTQPPAA